MTEEYSKVNQELYDQVAEQFRESCQNGKYPESKRWQKELKDRMRCLDYRLKNLGEQ